MHIEVFSDQAQFQDLIKLARGQLAVIRAHPSPEPTPDSPAHLAFDPTFARNLNTFVPLRVIPVPTVGDTWKWIDALLDGWQELSLLSQTTSITTWDVRYYSTWSGLSNAEVTVRSSETFAPGYLSRHRAPHTYAH